METYNHVADDLRPEAKQQYWGAAFGLQAVDNLKPSRYVQDLAEEHIVGEKTYGEVTQLTRQYYERRPSNEDEREADMVAEAIYAILADEAFRFDIPTFKSYHRRLFEKLNPGVFHPGQFREVNLTKAEVVLDGETVQYQDYGMIQESLEYDFAEESKVDYLALDQVATIASLANFTAHIWQVHPFYEGNTRTTAVFLEKYLRSLGYEVDNEMFAKHSREFRDALVLANYSNIPKGVQASPTRLQEFLRELLASQ